MISGFAQTILASTFLPLLTSITVTRLLIPICGAASPTPFAAYMDSNMSATSVWNSASNLSTSFAGVSSTGSPYLTMGCIIAPSLVQILETIQLPLISVEIPASLFDRVSAELFQKRTRQHQSHHGLASHAARRHDADVGAFVGRLNCFLGVHVGGEQGPPQG